MFAFGGKADIVQSCRDEARRIAVNVAKLLEFFCGRICAWQAALAARILSFC
jgi:hypothetical protein